MYKLVDAVYNKPKTVCACECACVCVCVYVCVLTDSLAHQVKLLNKGKPSHEQSVKSIGGRVIEEVHAKQGLVLDQRKLHSRHVSTQVEVATAVYKHYVKA